MRETIKHLNAMCKAALERAIHHCIERRHAEVGIGHLLLGFAGMPRSDFYLLLQRCDVDMDSLRADVDAYLDICACAGNDTPVFADETIGLLEQACHTGSPSAERAGHIRSHQVLMALLAHPAWQPRAWEISARLARVAPAAIRKAYMTAGHDMPEADAVIDTVAASSLRMGSTPENGGARQDECSETANALDRFTDDLTALARKGRLDTVTGRDAEIRQVIDILLCRRQNNPLLVGAAGVGKTAIAEGLAYRIVHADVPDCLRHAQIRLLDLARLQAGAAMKGEFENRFRMLMEAIRTSPRKIILFIDEAHMLVGAGGQSGQADAANLLKPALARGELRTIAATTWEEYKKSFERDSALLRRFQLVKIEEPDPSRACAMLRGLLPGLESHFQVRILNEAVEAAVALTARYIVDRQLPEKAIGVLEAACARICSDMETVPAELESLRQEVSLLCAEISHLQHESTQGIDHMSRLQCLNTMRDEANARLRLVETQWQQEKSLMMEIHRVRTRMSGTAMREPDDWRDSRARRPVDGYEAQSGQTDRLHDLLTRLREVQAASRLGYSLLNIHVDRHAIAAIVSEWTGLPVGRLSACELSAVQNLKPLLEQRIVGQPHAMETLACCVRTACADLGDPDKPRGVFLFVGPSGVGKTETAFALADILDGHRNALITINLSEYQEPHSIATLKGAPPGYVGHGVGGRLTEAVRKRPHCILLLDEIEKAHSDVLEMFFQVLDKGVLEDGEGRLINFRNVLIIMTSNVGAQMLTRMTVRQEDADPEEGMRTVDRIRPELARVFPAAFLGRVKVIPFYPLAEETLKEIIGLKLARVQERVREKHHVVVHMDDDLVRVLQRRCTGQDAGVREIDHVIDMELLPAIADVMLATQGVGKTIEQIRVSVLQSGQLQVVID